MERALAPDPRDSFESGFHVVADARGDLPQRPLTLVPRPVELDDEFEGLDRLDRDELDED